MVMARKRTASQMSVKILLRQRIKKKPNLVELAQGRRAVGGQKMRKKGVMMSRIVENTRMIRYGLKQERMTLFQTPTAIGISIKLNSQNLKIRSNTLMLHMILSETLQKEH
ncbi:hypothetical protein JT31_23045 [Cedecea neteri]|uniref:Uncharacterized protein n=1 Tax=Cedecea neteri TaxID=158822 RepID=A0A089QAA3_9ENTR|nr:hypothetical protein JT31_23045 [Cedecea neteri]